MKLTLEAEDDRGQTGRSEAKTFVLPGRPFANPLARAIIEQRRNLALDANSVRDIVQVIDVLTLYPEETIKNAGHFLGLVTTRSRLLEARGNRRGVARRRRLSCGSSRAPSRTATCRTPKSGCRRLSRR